MVVRYGASDFDESWLDLVRFDPVHPALSVSKRISGNRTILAYTHDTVPQFIICARIGNVLPANMSDILDDDGYISKYDIVYAVFYSIFRTPFATEKGIGGKAIKAVINELWGEGIRNFYTLSPIPQLRGHFHSRPDAASIRKYLEQWEGPVAKFHLGNGARIHSINFNADFSEQRIQESWGIMVNYDYNSKMDE